MPSVMLAILNLLWRQITPVTPIEPFEGSEPLSQPVQVCCQSTNGCFTHDEYEVGWLSRQVNTNGIAGTAGVVAPPEEPGRIGSQEVSKAGAFRVWIRNSLATGRALENGQRRAGGLPDAGETLPPDPRSCSACCSI